MADWTAQMKQEFEYYTVDPGTWKDVSLITTVKSCSIDRDYTADTLGSASFDVDEQLGERYIRSYLVTIQNGVRERHPLGIHLVQTPKESFNGRVTSYSLDAYTPLIELKENQPPLGYYCAKGSNVMDTAYLIMRDHVRAPIVRATSDDILYGDFVSNSDDTWLTFLSDLVANANFIIGLDELGRIIFEPKQDYKSLQPRYTYTDDNSSILYPEIELERDLYGIPNVVEVVYSDDGIYYYAVAVNDDPNSETSTISRGREITKRIENPEFAGEPTQAMVDRYAEDQLRNLSTLQYTLTYKHGYNDVKIGDCVRLNYRRANLKDIKARVTQQSIDCTQGCPVSETAVFTERLWR